MNTSKSLADAIRRPAFGDDATRDRFHDRARTSRLAQRVPIAVAPLTALVIERSGESVVLHEGQELLRSDLVAGSPVPVVLDALAERQAIIVLGDDEVAARSTPANARFVVARGGSVSTLRGNVLEGAQVRAADFARKELDLDDLVRRGAVIDRQPEPPQAA